jgi:peptidoglycan-associated lipoprotein
MRRQVLLAAALGLLAAGAAQAQSRWPMIVQRVIPGTRDQAPPPLAGIDALRAEFLARSGSDLVYFSGDSAVLSPQSKATLGAQAMWLRQHPEIVVRVEGHAELGDTRDHALALGARRAQEVRDYLILMGVPPAQLTVTSWGKERPGPPRTQTILVR